MSSKFAGLSRPVTVPPLRFASNNDEKGEFLIAGVTDNVATQRAIIRLDGDIRRGGLSKVHLVLKTVNTIGSPPSDMNTTLIDTDEAIPLSDIQLENLIYRDEGSPAGGLTGNVAEEIFMEVLVNEVLFITKGGGVGGSPPDPDNAGKGGFIQVIFEFTGGSGFDYDFIIQIHGEALD